MKQSSTGMSDMHSEFQSNDREEMKVAKEKRQPEDQKSKDSPTQVGNLEIKPSESLESDVSSSPKGCPVPLNRCHTSLPLKDETNDAASLLHGQICQGAPASKPSFSNKTAASNSKEALLHFMNTTTQLMDKFEAKVVKKLDALSNKIDTLDRKVRINRSKRRLDFVPTTVEEDGEKRSKIYHPYPV